MKKYYLCMNVGKANHAGSKAVLDCEKILKQAGYQPKLFYCNQTKNKYLNRLLKLFQLLSIALTPRESIIVCEHPLYTHGNYFRFLMWLKKHKKDKLCFLVHDLETLRHLLPDSERYVEYDSIMFSLADTIIVHNERMKEYLINEKKVCQKKIIELRIFDYLVAEGKENEFTDNSEDGVIIAGNLASHKSGYVYDLSSAIGETVKLQLYGVNFDKEKMSGENWEYKGSFDADELPFIMDGSYGLVWDGTTISKCDGPTGNYLRYNNPHKASLYVASGIPIIIWKEAALSKFIEEENIGISVDSLESIGEILSNISKEKYNEMKENSRLIGKKVRNGEFLKEALECMEKSLQ